MSAKHPLPKRVRFFTISALFCEALLFIMMFFLKKAGILQIKNLLSRTLLLFFAADILALAVYICKRTTGSENAGKTRIVCLALFFFACIASLPLCTDYINFIPGHDHAFHLIRIEGIADGLQHGEFPVRLHAESVSGYGYGNPLFYPELLLYFPACLRLLGFSVQAAYKWFCFFINLLTSGIAYLSFKGVFKTKRCGLAGAFLYTLSLYRLTCLYTRASIGEVTAILFLPLVLWGIYTVLTEKTELLGTIRTCLPLAFGMSGLILTHTLTAAITCGLLVVVCLLFIKRFVRCPRRLLPVLYAAGLTILLTAFYTVPMLWETFSQDIGIFTEELRERFVHAINPYQLFPLFPAASGVSEWHDSGVPGEMPLGLGFAALVAIMGWIFLWHREKRSPFKKAGTTAWWFLVILSIMTTELFPWEGIYRLGGILARFAGTLQFPWRLLSVSSALLVMLSLCLLEEASLLPFPKTRQIVCGVLCLLTLITAQGYTDTLMREAEVWRPKESTDLDRSWGVMNGEFLPASASADPEDYTGKPTCSDPGLTYADYVRSGNSMTVFVRNTSGAEQALTLPRLFYTGYKAESEGLPLACFEAENGLLAISLPAGFEGSVSLRFVSPLPWTLALVASVLSLLCITAAGLRKRKLRT